MKLGDVTAPQKFLLFRSGIVRPPCDMNRIDQLGIAFSFHPHPPRRKAGNRGGSGRF